MGGVGGGIDAFIIRGDGGRPEASGEGGRPDARGELLERPGSDDMPGKEGRGVRMVLSVDRRRLSVESRGLDMEA